MVRGVNKAGGQVLTGDETRALARYRENLNGVEEIEEITFLHSTITFRNPRSFRRLRR